MRERTEPPISEVVHTDDTAREAMRADGATSAQIGAHIKKRRKEAAAAQADYDRNAGPTFEASLQKQNQA